MLNELREAVYNAHSDYVKENYHDPKISVSFSPAGFCKTTAHSDAPRCFSNPNTSPDTVLGYPYSVDRNQQEDFRVLVA